MTSTHLKEQRTSLKISSEEETHSLISSMMRTTSSNSVSMGEWEARRSQTMMVEETLDSNSKELMTHSELSVDSEEEWEDSAEWAALEDSVEWVASEAEDSSKTSSSPQALEEVWEEDFLHSNLHSQVEHQEHQSRLRLSSRTVKK